MKTRFYRCKKCGNATMMAYGADDIEGKPCLVVRASPDGGLREAVGFSPKLDVCDGVLEYWAYDDMDRHK